MMDNSQSFTARRSAASNLPTFQLPPPDLTSLHKYPAFAPANASQPTPATSTILTPPAGVEGLSPLASSVNSGSSQSSTSGIAPYNNPSMNNFWPQTTSSYSFNTTTQVPSPFTQQYMGRPLYSPSMNFASRNATSPTSGEGLPPPPYELSLPSFPTSMGMSGPGAASAQSSLPHLAAQQQQQLANSVMHSHSASQAPHHQASVHAPEPYGGRPPPTPSYYAPASTPQQPSFPAYTQPSPTHHSPVSAAVAPRMSPVSLNQSSQQQQQQQHGQYRPYSGFSLPGLPGPIMSNVHSPGSQMALVGGIGGGGGMGGYAVQSMGHHLYGGHPGQQQPQNDRPFKCDQCPQSFNRNHDLKRHKRIHLAVKPFPCGHCEKSFSRKDALKRHILVKGCGKSYGSSTHPHSNSQSPLDKSEVMSDSTDDSPRLMKKEL